MFNHLLNLPEARDTIAAKSVNEANMTNGGLNKLKGKDLFPGICQSALGREVPRNEITSLEYN